jgi:hypothetical protein
MAKPLPRIDSEQPDNNRIKPGMTIHGKPGEELLEAALQNVTSQEPEENYVTSMAHVRRVDVLLPPKHRKILSDKIRKLQDAGAKLEDGTEVTDKAKAVLWILENEVLV